MIELVGANQSRARICVVGVGGGGGNAVNTMIRAGLSGVDFVIANTDIQALGTNEASVKVQIGSELTKGLGAGGNPDIGRKSALEQEEILREELIGCDMVFVTCGMGGGTGTGAAPVIARIAKDLGALTVGVVTKPFHFEGRKRLRQADDGVRELRAAVDTLIAIPNQRLIEVAGRNTTTIEAFAQADDVLLQAVRGISQIITEPGLINVDFADVRTIMGEMGMAMMGAGSGNGETRAVDAATAAISSPLLEDVSIGGARGVLVNITASSDFGIQEMNDAVDMVQQQAHEDANIIVGLVHDSELDDEVRITVIATGFGDAIRDARPPVEAQVEADSATQRAATQAEGQRRIVDPERSTTIARATAMEAQRRRRPLLDDSLEEPDSTPRRRTLAVAEAPDHDEFAFEGIDAEGDRAVDIPAYLRKRWRDRRGRTIR